MPVMVAGELVETPLERVKRIADPILQSWKRDAEIRARPAYELMRLTQESTMEGTPLSAGTLVVRINARNLLQSRDRLLWMGEPGECWVEGQDDEGRIPHFWEIPDELLAPAEPGTEMPFLWGVYLTFGNRWHSIYRMKVPLVPGKTMCMFGSVCSCPATRSTLKNEWGAVRQIYVCEAHDPGPLQGWYSAD